MKYNKKICASRKDGFNEIRIYHKKAQKKKSPRYLLKCGCCNSSLEVYYNEDSLEINGILGSVENWREILLPLLEKKSKKRRE